MMDRRYRARSRSRTGRRSAPSHRYGATYASANKPVVYSFFCLYIYLFLLFFMPGSWTTASEELYGSPVAVRAGASLLGRRLPSRVRQHSALSVVS